LGKNTGALLRTLTGHGDWVWSVAFDPDEILATTGDETFKLWEYDF
jgi:WD40 repeat protein